MTKEEFKSLKNFGLLEKDTSDRLITTKRRHIEPELMYHADYAVNLAKMPQYGISSKYPSVVFFVVDINLGEHTEGSLHYEGKAIDGYYYDTELKIILPLSMQFYLFQLAGFKGIGVYPEHKQPKVHGDIRNQRNLSVWYAYYSEIIRHDKKVKVQKYEYDRLKIAEVLGICG